MYFILVLFVIKFSALVYVDDFLLSITMAKIKSNSEEIHVSKPTISVALTMISIPLSMILWISNILFKKLYGDNENEVNGKLTNF